MQNFIWFACLLVVVLAITTCQPELLAQKAGTTEFAGPLPDSSLFPVATPEAESITISVPEVASIREWIQSVFIGALVWYLRYRVPVLLPRRGPVRDE